MTKRKLALALGIAAAFAVGAITVAAFSTGGSVPPQEGAVSDAPEAPSDQTASRASGSGGVGEGIGVEGNWVLTVLNQDGSVDSTHEFHNALLGAGRGTLAEILSGETVLDLSGGAGSNWTVQLLLGAGSFAGQCGADQTRDLDGSCTSGTVNGFHYYSQSTTATRNLQTVVLSLETDAFAGPASVERVRTNVAKCAPGDTNAASCTQAFLSAFTETTIAPVEIVEGQRILVTVTLSFGTLP